MKTIKDCFLAKNNIFVQISPPSYIFGDCGGISDLYLMIPRGREIFLNSNRIMFGVEKRFLSFEKMGEEEIQRVKDRIIIPGFLRPNQFWTLETSSGMELLIPFPLEKKKEPIGNVTSIDW